MTSSDARKLLCQDVFYTHLHAKHTNADSALFGTYQLKTQMLVMRKILATDTNTGNALFGKY